MDTKPQSTSLQPRGMMTFSRSVSKEKIDSLPELIATIVEQWQFLLTEPDAKWDLVTISLKIGRWNRGTRS